MTITSLMGLSAAMFILAASPGPGVFAVLGHSLASGVKRTLFMIAGIVTGDLFYLLFAIFGLTYVAKNVAGLFSIIRYMGGAYLIWMGYKAAFLWENGDVDTTYGRDAPPFSSYLSGLLITLSNPKVILFYCGFLPTFVDLGGLSFSEGGILVSLIALILGTVMTLYACLASSIATRVKTPRGCRIMNRSAGGVMMGAGVFLTLNR